MHKYISKTTMYLKISQPQNVKQKKSKTNFKSSYILQVQTEQMASWFEDDIILCH